MERNRCRKTIPWCGSTYDPNESRPLQLLLWVCHGNFARPSLNLWDKAAKNSASTIYAITKAYLKPVLTVVGRSVDVRVNKLEVVAAVMKPKADITDGTWSREGGTELVITTADDLTKQAARRIWQPFGEAILTSGVLQPLVPNVGMKESSQDEVELIRALPSFFADNKGAHRGVVIINILLGPAFQLNCVAHAHQVSFREQKLRDYS